MPRKRKALTPDAPLAPVPAEILDQFVRQGPMLARGARRGGPPFQEGDHRARARAASSRHHLGYPPGGDEAGRHDQSSQWDRRQDGADRRRPAGDRRAARSRGHLRAAADRQARAAVHRASTTRSWRCTRAGMTVREIQAFLAEMYAVEVSPDLISTVTDGDRRGGDGVAKPAARAPCIRSCSSMRCA